MSIMPSLLFLAWFHPRWISTGLRLRGVDRPSRQARQLLLGGLNLLSLRGIDAYPDPALGSCCGPGRLRLRLRSRHGSWIALVLRGDTGGQGRDAMRRRIPSLPEAGRADDPGGR